MSDSRQRLSGCEYKKRKAEKEANIKKQAGSLKKFFQKSTVLHESISANSVILTSDQVDENPIETDIAFTKTLTTLNDSSNHLISSESKELTLIIGTDPATWPFFLSDKLKTTIVEKGPPSPILKTFVFPLDDNNRRFTVFNYQRCLSNEENVLRTWLVYSLSKKVIFCYFCKLFSISKTKLGTDGYNDWRHVSIILKEHETSNSQLRAHQTWIEFSSRLKDKKTIDDSNQRIFESEKKYWNAVLQRIVSVIQLLGQQNLAFRGSSDQLYKQNNGNFLKIIELMALYDPIMSEHVRRTMNTKNKTHYLGKDIQNEIISLISGAIKTRILNMVKEAKYFSIILDCTPDLSHVEQMTIIIRFVFVESSKKESNVTICEHFLGFIPIETSTGMGLSDIIIQQLKDLGIQIENMRGQGYDNGANMKGKHSGVQRRIRNINPRAFFVPCCANSLNLVVNDTVKSSKEAIEFFDIIQKDYVFFFGIYTPLANSFKTYYKFNGKAIKSDKIGK
ncbi:zinc finger MYM-type protein 1-like [Sipha flava]|uniref:Zinc finger MYM-type protein 1-like n=1 Tax=Sipha flava TaxID=143950 RepID=A0A8B8GRU9_9HEMI|nr:zinc finger MYM-type protein 1-like [Sipha flava]